MKHFRKLTGPYFAWLVLFVLIPLVLIAIYAFTTSGNPVKTLNFTLMNFAKINEPTYIKVFIKSIEMGVLTTGVCLILGYPMAYLIAKCPEEMQDMLIMAVTIPTWINMLLRTYAWMNLLSDNGIINGLLSVLGINPVTMMYTNFSVVVGMVCNFMPKLLGGGQFVLIGNLIESQFVSVGDWNFGSAISLILAVLILVAMRLMKKMDVQDN